MSLETVIVTSTLGLIRHATKVGPNGVLSVREVLGASNCPIELELFEPQWNSLLWFESRFPLDPDLELIKMPPTPPLVPRMFGIAVVLPGVPHILRRMSVTCSALAATSAVSGVSNRSEASLSLLLYPPRGQDFKSRGSPWDEEDWFSRHRTLAA